VEKIPSWYVNMYATLERLEVTILTIPAQDFLFSESNLTFASSRCSNFLVKTNISRFFKIITLQRTNISHQTGKRKIMDSKSAVPWC